MKDVNQLTSKMKRDVLYKLSMSSIELFHSNFWAWMFQTYKESIAYFFKDIATFKDVSQIIIKREYLHFDLYLEDGQDYYLIENKIKSIPSQKQLEDYSQKTISKKNFKRGIIAGIVRDAFQDLKHNEQWGELDYQEIARRIKDFHDEYISKHENYDRFDFELINRYQNMIGQLSCLVQTEMDNATGYNLNSKALSDIGFVVIYKKLIGSILKSKLINYPQFLKWKPYFVWEEDVYDKINRGQNLTTSIYLQSTQDNIVFEIQIENYDYRRGIRKGFNPPQQVGDRKHKKELAKKLFDVQKAKYPIWFINHVDKINSFVTPDYIFVYQKQAPLNVGISFDSIIERVVCDIELLHQAGYIKEKTK